MSQYRSIVVLWEGDTVARSAKGKLVEARELDQEAARLSKSDAASAGELRELARGMRRKAIKQLKPRKRRKAGGAFTANRRVA